MPTTIEALTARLEECMIRDRRRLRHRLHALGRGTAGAGDREGLEKIGAEIERSAARRARRVSARPTLTFPADLPVVGRKEDLSRAIAANQVVVVCGETGSGKTTQLPKICLELGRGAAGLIGHTQPRRIAARSVAARIAEELGVSVGREVGFKVRFGDQTSADTMVKVMTDGILLAETQGDRLLEEYDTLIIDEAHERNLNIDFLLGYIRQLLPRRPDLKVIVTSATIDPERFARHFASGGKPAPIVEVSGRTYPVEVRYRPLADEDDADPIEGIVGAIEELASIDPSGHGDVLVFLPGEREIRETAEVLREHHPPQTEILPLYARLSVQEQMRVFRPHGGRRIVLATNVAETSLTVPGIRYVVDPGVARINRYSARTKVQRLPIEPVSRASANQRAGRCGRVAAGVCIRLYSEEDYKARPEFTDPEILRTNLASVILQMKALQLGAVESFPFVEPPDSRMIRDGYDTLRELGAVDERGELTSLGRDLARLPIDPRIGRMVLEAKRENCLAEVLVIAAALSSQDPRERPMEKQEAADQAHRQFRDETSDFLGLLNLWRWYHEESHHLSQSKLRKLCRETFLSYMRMREWHDVRQQLHALVTEMGFSVNTKHAESDSVHRAVLSGLLSNVGSKSPEGPEYKGTRGSSFYVFPGSALFKQAAKWVVAGEVVMTTKMYARSVAKIQPEWVERLGTHLLTRTVLEPHWSAESGQAYGYEKVLLFGLEIVARRRVPLGPADPKVARELFIHHALVEGDSRLRAPFLTHNQELIDELSLLEAKSRRAHLVADSQARFAFYDRVVPPEIYDTNRFEKWRKDAEKKNPRLLHMTRAVLLLDDASDVTPEQFPDRLKVGDAVLPLGYICEPGTPKDGVTITVPLELLGQIDTHEGDRLVPGMLKAKVEALVKSLPKGLRKYIPDQVVAECITAIRGGAGVGGADGSLTDLLASAIAQRLPLEITSASFKIETLPEHLFMNYRVVDSSGRELAQGRDLGELRKRLAPQVKSSFKAASASPLTRENIKDWDFGDLPEHVMFDRGAMTLKGFPALVEEGMVVSLRILDTKEGADLAMPRGLRRLMMIRARDELRHRVRILPGIQRMTLHYATLGAGPALADDLSALVAERAFLAEPVSVRSKAQFDAILGAGWKRLGPATVEAAQVAEPILQNYHAVLVRLSELKGAAYGPAIADVKSQLAEMIGPGFLARTPWAWLQQLARYLAAIDTRLRKLALAGLARDTRDMGQIGPHWAMYLTRKASLVEAGRQDPALEQVRWMIEEMRVSLFAQELGTAVPVSMKRLDEWWSRARG